MTEYFDMSLNWSDTKIIREVVNQGIDSRLEGFTQSNFQFNHNAGKLECKIHPAEMSILLRRLEELEDENAYLLANDIIQVYYGKEIM